jgi:hypothetical protein
MHGKATMDGSGASFRIYIKGKAWWYICNVWAVLRKTGSDMPKI